MHLLAYVHEGPLEVEIAILKISAQEHETFHKDPKEFVNKNQVFGKSVREVKVYPASHSGVESNDSWLLVIPHYPPCRCEGLCIAARDSSSSR